MSGAVAPTSTLRWKSESAEKTGVDPRDDTAVWQRFGPDLEVWRAWQQPHWTEWWLRVCASSAVPVWLVDLITLVGALTLFFSTAVALLANG